MLIPSNILNKSYARTLVIRKNPLFHLQADISELHSWPDKYAGCIAAILGAKAGILKLKKWLMEWKKKTNVEEIKMAKKKKKPKKEDKKEEGNSLGSRASLGVTLLYITTTKSISSFIVFTIFLKPFKINRIS